MATNQTPVPNQTLANQTVAGPEDLQNMTMANQTVAGVSDLVNQSIPPQEGPQQVPRETPPTPAPVQPSTPQGDQVLAGAEKPQVAELTDLQKAEKQALIDRGAAFDAEMQAQQAEQAQQATAPATTESTSTVNPDGSTTTQTNDYATPEAQVYKKQLDDANQSIDTEIEYAKSKYRGIMEGMDSAQQAMIASIEKTFEVRKYEMERINKAALNTQQLLGARSGRQRYAPEIQSSILSEEERAGLVRLTEIEAKELETIANATVAFEQGKLDVLNSEMTVLGNMRQEKMGIISEMYNLAVKEEERAQTRAAFEVNLQTAIQSYEQQEVTFNKEMQEYETSYLAQNLVQMDEMGNVTIPTIEEITGIAADFGVDPMILNAKAQQTMRDLQTYDVSMRASVLQNRQLELANQIDTFGLERSKALLPYEINMAAFDLATNEAALQETLSQLKMQSVNTGQLDQKDLDKLDKTEEKKRLDTLRKLKTALKNYDGLIEEYGKASFLQPGQKRELEAARTEAIGVWKDYQSLGALTGPDLELAETAIPTVIEGIFQAITPFGMGKANRAQKVIENSINTIDEEATASWENLIRRNSKYDTAKYTRGLYRPFAEEDFYVDYSDWAQNAPEEEVNNFVNSLINAGVDESDQDAVKQLWDSQYLGIEPFNNDLSTSVKGIKDFTSVVTSVGTGTATGIERGSELWEYGFDFVLSGGKGAPVRVPFSGEVVEAGTAGGFGNSVVIKLADGRKIRASHLDDIRVRPGQRVSSQTVLGGQGNTGSTLGKTGIHVDYTMYKPDGTPYNSQQVASFFNTRALT